MKPASDDGTHHRQVTINLGVGVKGFAFASALCSSVSKAIFWASMNVARNQLKVRHKAPAFSRQCGIVQLDDIRPNAVEYAVSLAGVAADNLEIIARVVLGQLIPRKPFPQQLEATLLTGTWAQIPFVKGSGPL